MTVIVWLWRTRVDSARMAEYEAVFFLLGAHDCAALSIRKDRSAVDARARALQVTGLLRGAPTVEVVEG